MAHIDMEEKGYADAVMQMLINYAPQSGKAVNKRGLNPIPEAVSEP